MANPKPLISLDVSPGAAHSSPETLRDWIRGHRIEEIECVTPDFAGIPRGKVMPAAKFLKEGEVRLPTSIFYATIDGDYADIGDQELYSDADLTLVPDYGTARAVPWASEPSLVIVHDLVDRHGDPVGASPREVLARVLREYDKEGWRPVVAPELEFYLTKPNPDPDYPLEPPIGRSGRQTSGGQPFAISGVDEYDRVIEHIYDYADAQRLEIDTIIREAGAAQLEINVVHGDAMELADQIFHFKRLIREAALRCDCYATFMAKPMANQPGSAMHIHQSVVDRETGKTIFSDADGAETDFYRWFIGGHQTHFHAATVLAAPYVNSYRRLVPGLSAPINLDWGVDNRSTGLRAPVSPPAARRIENRVVGADANPYLAIAATLACGLLGMRERREPRTRVTGNTYARGERSLPHSLLGALNALEASEPLTSLLGPDFVKLYTAVKREEHLEFMKVISPWEREHLLLNV